VTLVMVSIDGVTAQTFESIRRGARFERVLGNLVRLRRLRDAAGSARPLLVANFVLMRKNVHEAPLLVAVARELGLDYIDFRHVVAGAGYDASADTLETDPARFNYYRQLILASAKAQGVAVCIPPPLPSTTDFDPRSEPVATLQDLRRAVTRAPAVSGSVPSTPFPAPTRELDGTPAEVFHRLFCTRPFSEIMIRDQDEILPCPFYKQVLGRLSSGRSLREVFGGEAFRRLRQRMLLAEGDPGCADCPIKRGQLSQDMYGLE
jgi:MoaA/NifB/PqqE/SkfB family radical SAM enzyme